MAIELPKPHYADYYKSAIRTQDDFVLSNVVCYDGLILGTPKPGTHKGQYILMRYSTDAEPQTLWQGEINRFQKGYNLEIFPHPTIQGDYLVFTHPMSNVAGSMCYWLSNHENAPMCRCINITSAQTKLIGLKYIHYHAGKFIGVFYRPTPGIRKRINIGTEHQVFIAEIQINAIGAKGQILFSGKDIKTIVENRMLLMVPDHHPNDFNQPYVINRICSYKKDNFLVFGCGNNMIATYHYNIDTQVITEVKRYNINNLMPNVENLELWEGDNDPLAPIAHIRTFPIPGSNNLLVQEELYRKIYLYKESENRFYRSDWANLDFEECICIVKFITGNILVIGSSKRICLAWFDADKFTLNHMCQLDTIYVCSVFTPSLGAIIVNDMVYEPINPKSLTSRETPFTNKVINKMPDILTQVAPGIASLIGKFIIIGKSTKPGS